MALPLPHTLVAGTNENVTQVQANFDSLAASFPLAANATNFAAVPQVRVTNSAVQSIPNATATALTFDTESHDSGTASSNMHDTGSNTSRLTCRVAGLYLVAANASFPFGIANEYLSIRLNGTTTLATLGIVGDTAGVNGMSVITTYRLAVSDYVEAMIYQDSGGAKNTQIVGAGSVDQKPIFEAVLVSL